MRLVDAWAAALYEQSMSLLTIGVFILQAHYQIVHQIPERIRVKIPQLLRDERFVQKLQEQMANIKGITQIRINPLADSLILDFKEKLLSSQQVQAALAIALQQLAMDGVAPVSEQSVLAPPLANSLESAEVASIEPLVSELSDHPQDLLVLTKRPNQLTTTETPVAQESPAAVVKTPEAVMQFAPVGKLTAYEWEQIQQIIQWWQQEPGLLARFGAGLLTPLEVLSDIVIPEVVIDQVFNLVERCAWQWQTDWITLKTGTHQDHPLVLQQGELEVCDRLAEVVKHEAVLVAAAEGTLTGLFEGIGELTEVPLSVVLAMRTIYKTGLGYGFTPETQLDRLFGWLTLAIATAQTPTAKQQALAAFYTVQERLYRLSLDQVLEGAVEDEGLYSIKVSVFHQAISFLIEDLSGEDLPVIGMALGAIACRTFIQQVSDSARKAYQIRWLLTNKKLDLEQLTSIGPDLKPTTLSAFQQKPRGVDQRKKDQVNQNSQTLISIGGATNGRVSKEGGT